MAWEATAGPMPRSQFARPTMVCSGLAWEGLQVLVTQDWAVRESAFQCRYEISSSRSRRILKGLWSKWNADDGSEWRWQVEFYNHR